jgi:hypothetical protein
MGPFLAGTRLTNLDDSILINYFANFKSLKHQNYNINQLVGLYYSHANQIPKIKNRISKSCLMHILTKIKKGSRACTVNYLPVRYFIK